jgi:phospholipid/cholesterol/gamma-HCH transport system substrate-binding protein
MSSINSLSSNLNDIILKNESIINYSLNNVSSISENFKLISDSLSKSSIKNSIDQFNRLTINLNSIIDSINYGSGNLSLLLNEDSLYQNLKHSSNELNSLIKDLKLNPKRYVHFSLFGKKDKPFKVDEK